MSRLLNSNNHEIVLASPILKNIEKDIEVENVVNNDDGVEESEDWSTPLAFSDERHLKKIEPAEIITQSWRLKERMKTVSVALVLCLNVGVDPPDVVKTQPAARMECWIDPLSMSPQKALENIGSNLQKQYERWQPRARYKQTLDPTAEEIKKVTTTLRRNAKDERVLFHYNGHGVPKPTANGEIWVFNRSYTQYIPLSIYDLQSWMWSPSIYVFDCSNAGMIIDWFQQFAEQHQREYEQLPAQRGGNQSQLPPPPSFKQCIQLAACATNQILPMNPELPADLFTSCLTTPIKMALRWFVLQNTSRLVPRITLELVDKIPGQLNDRRTMLGELNWIFTAITDTIAWNSLPRELFQRLFRQDLLVASLFRNYLLAERIMRSYDCTPVSHPKLPPTYQHPMWAAWDLALDVCLSQLSAILEDKATFQISMFFEEQLTAFQVWLSHGCEERAPPEQLPIVLQVLLSQVHRVRALELLGRFLDLGSWAVNQALSVGIFPYVLKLLQSSARELRPMLLFIWAKILAVDVTCQVDLVRDGGHKYFLSVLQEPDVPNDQRTLAAFVLARIVWDYSQGQEAVTQAGFISHALELVHDSPSLLRRWLIIGVGLTWHLDESARWYAVRDSAHEKLFPFLQDSVPEVRCATVFAFATFIRSGSKSARSEHANNIDQSIALRLANYIQSEASPIVRKEIISALQWIVLIFESTFVQLVLQQMDDERQRDQGLSSPLQTSTTDYGGGLSRNNGGLNRVHSYQTLGTSPDLPSPLVTETSLNSSASSGTLSRLRRPASSSSLNNLGYPNSPGLPNLSVGSIYGKLWTALTALEKDPHPDVAAIAQAVCEYIRAKAKSSLNVRDNENMRFSTSSTSSSESQRYEGGESPPRSSQRLTPSLSRIRKRSVPTTIAEEGNSTPKTFREPIVGTSFVEWSVRRWSSPNSTDPVSAESAESKETFYLREWRFARNATVRTEARKEQQVAATGRLDEQLFCNRNPWVPSAIKFHPYDSWLAVADKEGCTVWDWERGVRLCRFINPQPKIARITSIEFVNGHDDAMLLVGSDDGTVRVWRNFLSSEVEDSASASLVTAWHCMPEMANAMHYSGLVLTWDQDNQTLAATGDLKVIRLWDVNKELRICDIPTGSDKCVTCIHQSAQDRNLFLIGCGDGSVRLFDRRLQVSRSRVQTWREHAAWIVDADWMNATTIVSGSLAGDVRFWDPRSSGSSNSFQTSQAMTAMAVHPSANIFACGSVNEYISVHNLRAGLVSTIKYHDGGGFMGHRIGAVSCLTFHPHRVCLAAGGMDSLVSVFATEKIRK